MLRARGNDLHNTVAKTTYCCDHTTHNDPLWTAADWLGDVPIDYTLFQHISKEYECVERAQSGLQACCKTSLALQHAIKETSLACSLPVQNM